MIFMGRLERAFGRPESGLQKILANSFLPAGSLQSFARKLIEEEELKSARAVEKTDVVARLGPDINIFLTLVQKTNTGYGHPVVEINLEDKEVRRFAHQWVNELWQTDVMYGCT